MESRVVFRTLALSPQSKGQQNVRDGQNQLSYSRAWKINQLWRRPARVVDDKGRGLEKSIRVFVACSKDTSRSPVEVYSIPFVFQNFSNLAACRDGTARRPHVGIGMLTGFGQACAFPLSSSCSRAVPPQAHDTLRRFICERQHAQAS
jgi:hypothetical protein